MVERPRRGRLQRGTDGHQARSSVQSPSAASREPPHRKLWTLNFTFVSASPTSGSASVKVRSSICMSFDCFHAGLVGRMTPRRPVARPRRSSAFGPSTLGRSAPSRIHVEQPRRRPVPRQRLGRRLLPLLRSARPDAGRRAADRRRRPQRRNPGRRLGPERDPRRAPSSSARAQRERCEAARVGRSDRGRQRPRQLDRPIHRAAANGGR